MLSGGRERGQSLLGLTHGRFGEKGEWNLGGQKEE